MTATMMRALVLRRHGGLSDLETLNLQGTKVTDKGVEYLKKLTKLQALDLAFTAVSDAGLEPLKKLEKLQSINLARTKVTPEGVVGLQKALPKAKIIK